MVNPLRLVEQWRRALERARRGELAVLRHPWRRPVPDGSVQDELVKVLCADVRRLAAWGARHALPPQRICHHGRVPHFDLWGEAGRRAWEELSPATLGRDPDGPTPDHPRPAGDGP